MPSRIAHTLRSMKKSSYAICAIVAAFILIDIYGVISFASVKQYESIASTSEAAFAQEILETSDRSLRNCLDSFDARVSAAAHAAEGSRGAQEELQAFSQELQHEGLAFMGAFAVADGSISYTPECPAAPNSETLLRAIESGQASIDLGETGPVVLFHTQAPSGTTLGIFVAPEDFFGQAFGSSPQSDSYRICLHDPNSGCYMYPQGGQLVAESSPSANTVQNNGLSYLGEASASGSLRSGFFNYTDEDGESSLHRIHCIPAPETVNQAFSIALCSNYQAISSPGSTLIGNTAVAAGVVIVVLLLLILGIFLLVYSRYQDLAQIRALQERNRELSLLQQQMNQNLHQQRLETIGTMTSGIAHEFNNLLTPIMTYSALAIDETEGECRKEEIQDHLTEIFTASERAKELVGRISSLSRKSSDSSVLPVILDDLLAREAESFCQMNGGDPLLETSLQAPGARILANPAQISQLVMNLLVNASHAVAGLEAPTARVGIATRVEGKQLLLSVSDNGCGIPEEQQQRIFDPFFTTKAPGQGTGLGLAIVKQIVEEHGATIKVESQPGAGAVFTVRFPVAKQEQQASQIKERS